MSTDPATVVREYYEALRSGDPLEPYVREDESTVKFGISEALFGYDEVASALREQTATTEDWTVESHALTVQRHGSCATFADEVTMDWRRDGESVRVESRWSGTLTERDGTDPDWQFATMHVSAPREL